MTKPEQVYYFTSLIPKGRVSTYAQIAKVSGISNPRVVGNILHLNKDPEKIPCHRVVRSNGCLASNYAFGGPEKQRAKLETEGIVFVKDRINLSEYQWNPTLT